MLQKLKQLIKRKNEKYNLETAVIVLIILVPVLIGGAVLYRFISPFGLIVNYNFNIAENAELFGKINNVDRTAEVILSENSLEIKDKFDITKEQIEFSVAPIVEDFDEIEVRISMSEPSNSSTLLQVNDFGSKQLDNFLIRNTALSELGNHTYEYDGFKVWAFNPNLLSTQALETFKNEQGTSGSKIKTCTMDTPFIVRPNVDGGETLATPAVFPHVLRGTHTFNTVVDDAGSIYMGFKKRDLNWYSGSDDMIVKVKKDTRVVSEYFLTDDGVFDGEFGRPLRQSQELIIDLTNLEKGIYTIEVDTNEDVLITDIKTLNSKLVLTKEVFLANNEVYGLETKPVNIYTYSPRVFVTTYHDTAKQTVNINGEDITLEKLQNFESLNLQENRLNQVTFTESDLRLSANDYFALSEDGYFQPTVIDEISCLNFPAEIIKQQELLAVKNIAVKEDADTYLIKIPYKKSYIGPEGKVYFNLYNPGIGVDEEKVEIKELKVQFKRN